MGDSSEQEPKTWREWIRSKLDPRHLKIAKIAALLGAVVAIVCHFVPKDYRAICDAVATLCGG